jgi:ABC-2 type transport system ATP-binding protein
MAVIEAVGLGKRYGDRAAVINLSFRVDPGSVTGFLGPNGSGKSTTMRLMLGLDNGDGRTTFDGQEFRALRNPMRSVGACWRRRHSTRRARPATTCGCSRRPTTSPTPASTRSCPWSG